MGVVRTWPPALEFKADMGEGVVMGIEGIGQGRLKALS